LPNRRIRQGTGSAGNEAYNKDDNSLRDGVQAPPAAGVSKALFFSKIVTASFLCECILARFLPCEICWIGAKIDRLPGYALPLSWAFEWYNRGWMMQCRLT
jgi:hypothetical protein